MASSEASPLLHADAVKSLHGDYTVASISSSSVSSTRRPRLSISVLIGEQGSMPSMVNPTGAPPVSPLSASRRNPFHYASRIDAYEWCKMILVCALGIPLLRLALILLALLLLIVFCTLATLGFTPVDPKTKQRIPLPAWRRAIASPRPFLIRIILFALGYHWISVTLPKGGLPKKGPRIVVCNHISFIDGPFFASYYNSSIAMKAELGRIPLVGRIIQSLQPILIDRNTPQGRKQAITDIADHLANAAFPPLLIFPEGTTSNQDYLTKFKVGSFASGLPCQPVVLKYPFKHFDVSWTPDVSGLYLLVRMLCQVNNTLEVEFLPPYYPSEEEKKQPALYAENVRQCMAEKLQVACTNHAFEDVALLLRVGNYAEQHVVPITDVGEIATLTALRSGDVQTLVQYFIQRDADGDGQISLEEMTSLFPMDSPELLERLFLLLDTDGSGSIDFRELCMGLAALNPSRDPEELIGFSFRLYDLDGDGFINNKELNAMVTFLKSFYGDGEHSEADLKAELPVDANGRVTFEVFSQFMQRHPTFLGHAKSKLEMLRGSFP
jgi:lysophosphatidylcholine acyltransferase / lyso-PAF acetyltransferase